MSKASLSTVSFWSSSPLTTVRTRNAWWSGTSSAVTSHGPNPPLPKKFFPMPYWRVWNCQSRTLASLKHA